jgi:hypothetical protein
VGEGVDEMSQFYVTLPSDSSSKYYSNNTVARFVTKLPEHLSLEGDYLVGLVELIYPHSWYNIDESRTLWFGIANRERYTVEAGYYPSPELLVAKLNETCQKIVHENPDCNILKIAYNEVSRKVYLQVDCTLYVSNILAGLLGLKGQERDDYQVFKPGWHKSKLAVDVNAGFSLMYIYCDIVAYSSVGDVKAPLLAIVPTSGSFGHMIREVYTDPHYVPVQRKDLDAIEISINNEEGRPMPFEFGKSVVKLHFKRVNPLQ